jgi:IclR family acetate operon transcriptional repressor
MIPPPSRRPRVQSVARAAVILRAVAASDSGLTATQIAGEVGLSRPTTYHLLHTLRDEGLLARGPEREYRLGFAVASLAQAFARQLAPPEHLLPYVRALARRTGETAYIATWTDDGVVLLASVPGHHAVTVASSRVGLAEDPHARASGKVLLSQLSAEARAAFLTRSPFTIRTPQTIAGTDAFERELELTRSRGYATDLEEYNPGVCCLAAGLDSGVSPFALSLSAPRDRFQEHFDAYRRAVLEIAAAASRGLDPS